MLGTGSWSEAGRKARKKQLKRAAPVAPANLPSDVLVDFALAAISDSVPNDPADLLIVRGDARSHFWLAEIKGQRRVRRVFGSALPPLQRGRAFQIRCDARAGRRSCSMDFAERRVIIEDAVLTWAPRVFARTAWDGEVPELDVDAVESVPEPARPTTPPLAIAVAQPSIPPVLATAGVFDELAEDGAGPDSEGETEADRSPADRNRAPAAAAARKKAGKSKKKAKDAKQSPSPNNELEDWELLERAAKEAEAARAAKEREEEAARIAKEKTETVARAEAATSTEARPHDAGKDLAAGGEKAKEGPAPAMAPASVYAKLFPHFVEVKGIDFEPSPAIIGVLEGGEGFLTAAECAMFQPDPPPDDGEGDEWADNFDAAGFSGCMDSLLMDYTANFLPSMLRAREAGPAPWADAPPRAHRARRALRRAWDLVRALLRPGTGAPPERLAPFFRNGALPRTGMKPWHANLLHRIFLKHYIAMRTTVTAFADPHVRQRWRAVDAPQSDKAAHAGAAFVLCDFFLPAFNYACGLLASLMSSRPVAARVARDPNFLDQLAFAGASMVAIKAAPGFHGRPELPIGWYTCSDILNAVDICSLAVAENRNPWHQTSHGAVIMGQHVPAELLYINAGAINGVFEQGASHPGTDPSRGPRFAARRLILSLVVERDVEKNPVLSLRREALKACIAARLPGDDACDACYKPGPLSTVCGNCGFGTFCSGDCLRAGFEDHKTVCKQIGMGMIRSMQELRAKQLEHRKLMPKKR